MKSLIYSTINVLCLLDLGRGVWEGRGTHNPVEFTALVALWPTQVILRLAGTELSEVLGSLGDYIAKELEGYAAQRLSCSSISLEVQEGVAIT